MNTLDLVVVMPVFNEQGTIGSVVRRWDAEVQKLGIAFEIHVYNDGSSDETAAIVESFASETGRIKGHNKPNAGHGRTIRQGYLEHYKRCDWLFQVDSDDEMGPEWFYKLWNIRHDHDLIVGKRYERVSVWSRKLVSGSARVIVNALYGPCIYDVNCPYRLMRSSTFAPGFESIPPETFATNVLLSGFAARNHLKTVEVHIPHRSRYSGRVSIGGWRLLRGVALSSWQTLSYRLLCPSIGSSADEGQHEPADGC
jgi:glycosyltransferase involved in cell wall biosynthesis